MSDPTPYVEFLLDADTSPPSDQPAYPAPRFRRLVFAVLAGLGAAATIVSLAGRPAQSRPAQRTTHAAAPLLSRPPGVLPPHLIRRQLPPAMARILGGTLPGIAINNVLHQTHPTGACADPAVPRLVDASYRRLLIQIEITPSRPRTTLSTVRTISSGASDVYVLRSERRSAHCAVTISVTAPPQDHVPVQALHRIAEALAGYSVTTPPPPRGPRSVTNELNGMSRSAHTGGTPEGHGARRDVWLPRKFPSLARYARESEAVPAERNVLGSAEPYGEDT